MAEKAPSGAQGVLRAIALLKAFTLESPRETSPVSRSKRGCLAVRSIDFWRRSRVKPFQCGVTTVSTVSGRQPRRPVFAHYARARGARPRTPSSNGLAEQTGETATFEVLSEGKMLILDEVLGARLTGASPSLGTAWALHATSTGKAILAAVPTERVAELLPRSLDRFSGKTITDRARLDEALDEALANGYATAREELAKGYSAAGAVIRTPMLKPYAALSLRGPSARLHPAVLEELGARVKSCADAVPARLGYEG